MKRFFIIANGQAEGHAFAGIPLRLARSMVANLAVEVDYADEARVRRWIGQRHYTLEPSSQVTERSMLMHAINAALGKRLLSTVWT